MEWSESWLDQEEYTVSSSVNTPLEPVPCCRFAFTAGTMRSKDCNAVLKDLNDGWLGHTPWCVHAQQVGVSRKPGAEDNAIQDKFELEEPQVGILHASLLTEATVLCTANRERKVDQEHLGAVF